MQWSQGAMAGGMPGMSPGAGYGPAAGAAAQARAGPYQTGPLPSGPLAPGALKAASPAEAGAAAAAPAALPGIDFLSPELEKSNLVKKLYQLQKSNPSAKAKWWSFCKVHGEGNFDASKFDSAFLLTFFEVFESGDIPDEPGNPYTANPSAPGGDDQGWQQMGGGYQGSGYQGGGYQSGGYQDAGATAGCGQDAGAGQQVGEKIFVGGLPKAGTTDDAVWKHFEWYGPVADVALKYDPEGSFRGFAFVTFKDASTAAKVLADKNMKFQGKWIDCKLPTGVPGKGKGGDKGDKGGKGGFKGDNGKSGWGSGGNDWGGGYGGYGGYGGSKGSKDGGKPKGSGPGLNDDLKVFVGGLPKVVTQDSVWAFFSQYGEVKSVDLKYDETNTFRGFGFITFMTAEAVNAAINNPAGNIVEGKRVDVRAAAAKNKGGGKDGKDGKGGDKGKGGKDAKGGWGMGGGCGGWGGGWGW